MSYQLCLSFTITEEFAEEAELVTGGKSREVNDSNKLEYVFRFVNHKVQKQFEVGAVPFLAGLNEIIPKELLKVFNETELQTLISGGDSKIDIEDLAKHTNYVAGYAAKNTYIKVLGFEAGLLEHSR